MPTLFEALVGISGSTTTTLFQRLEGVPKTVLLEASILGLFDCCHENHLACGPVGVRTSTVPDPSSRVVGSEAFRASVTTKGGSKPLILRRHARPGSFLGLASNRQMRGGDRWDRPREYLSVRTYRISHTPITDRSTQFRCLLAPVALLSSRTAGAGALRPATFETALSGRRRVPFHRSGARLFRWGIQNDDGVARCFCAFIQFRSLQVLSRMGFTGGAGR